jgi:hypothetical protein
VSRESGKKAPSSQAKVSADHRIRLKPSSSDYATFVRTTANAIEMPDLISSKTKPDMRVISLANLGS